jgi:hypothetical protein
MLPSSAGVIDRIGVPSIAYQAILRLKTAAVLALIFSLIASCSVLASDDPPIGPTVVQTPQPVPVVLKTQTGWVVEVILLGAKDIEINNEGTDTSENTLFALTSVPAGLVMAVVNPFYIAAPIVGIASIPAGQAFKQQTETVATILDPALVTNEIANSMIGRLQNEQGIAAGTRYVFSIASYGLAARDGAPKVFEADREVCLFINGELRVNLPTIDAEVRPFVLTSSLRSPGLPPPLCQPFDQFASDDGKSLRAALRETAHVIGAWSAKARSPQ